MKDLAVVICEDMIEEIEGLAGAAIGGAAGAFTSAIVWVVQKIRLTKQLSKCKNPECIKQVRIKMQELNKRAIKKTTIATIAGAGIGGVAELVGNAISAVNSLDSAGAGLDRALNQHIIALQSRNPQEIAKARGDVNYATDILNRRSGEVANTVKKALGAAISGGLIASGSAYAGKLKKTITGLFGRK